MSNLSQMKREVLEGFIDRLMTKIGDSEEDRILLAEVKKEIDSKRYGLIWEEHSECVDEQLEMSIPVFREEKDRRITVNEEEPYNFLLEGDNLHSLYLLNKTHRGKIDLIYIDPPYNTGNKDFKYNDKYIDFEDEFRHSKWLSFMKRRLVIAKDLLTERGAIFIQINDIELANLKCLCDLIFGEQNFLNIICVNVKNIAGASGGGEDKRFKKNCEYILVYSKMYETLPLFNGAYDYIELYSIIEQYKKDNKNWHYTSVLVDKGEKEYIGSTVDGNGDEIKIYRRKNCKVQSINQIVKETGLSEKEVYYKYISSVFEAKDAQSSIRKRVLETKNKLNITDDIISIEYIPKTGKRKGTVYEQFYKGNKCRLIAWLSDITECIDGVIYRKSLQGTYWDYTSKINNLNKEGLVAFSNGKKPVELIQQIINLFPDNCITVLDFFAGSGTTGHAIESLNKKDGGKRKYILCTNNENKICEEITYKRLNNIQPELPHNLKYFKTDYIGRDEPELYDLLQENVTCLIELENACDASGDQLEIIFTDEQLESFLKSEKRKNCNLLYVSSMILLPDEVRQELEAASVKIMEIPEYYFGTELYEQGF